MTETPQETLSRFTMPIGDVAAAFNLPKTTLRNRMKSGMINLSARRFGLNTSPFLYDPAEVEPAVAAYWKRVNESGSTASTDEDEAEEFRSYQLEEAPHCAAQRLSPDPLEPPEYCLNDTLPGYTFCPLHSGQEE